MNPERLYKNMKYDSLVEGLVAPTYTTFVAMPFSDYFNYKSSKVFSLICDVVESISQTTHHLEKPFSRPMRVDLNPPNAADLTEQIAGDIMRCHFFIADLSFGNHGALIETGIAMAIKPSESITLLSQGGAKDLHFDITVNRVNSYKKPADVRRIIQASLLEGARHFEANVGSGLNSIRQNMTPEALHLIQTYALTSIQTGHSHDSINTALIQHPIWTGVYGGNLQTSLHFYTEALNELRDKGLVKLDYNPISGAYGFHATRFGAELIRRTWPVPLSVFRSVLE